VRAVRRTLLAAALLLAVGSPALAQRVEIRGRGDAEHDVFLRALVRSGDYTLLSRDTLIARGDTVHGNALVLLGTLRLDGVVTGDLVIVDANVFLRPSARVHGSVHNIAGGYYPSELATVGGPIRSAPNAPYMAQLRDDALIIQGTAQPSPIVTPGLRGFGIPTYDRVDGLTLSYSAGLLLPRVGRVEPIIRGRLDYRSQRGAFTGGLELGLPRGDTELLAGAERATMTNEEWIRDGIENSISFLFLGKDYRDYYEADRFYVELRRTLESGPRTTTAFLRAQLEDGRTLAAGSPWTALGTVREDNLAVDDGRISSVLAGAALHWEHPVHVVRARARAEAAGRVLDAEHAFRAWNLDIDWALAALADHTLRIEGHFSGPLPGTDSLPRQRWSFVGGSGTVHTFEFAEFRGDRVVHVATRYIIPLRPLRMRALGTPDLELLHRTGMAWTAASRPGLEQNVGLRLRAGIFNVRLLADPADWTSRELSVGLNLPRRAYPWERRAAEAREGR
jgi:hypothetical protein